MDEPPDRVSAEYTNDLDIITIHELILKTFTYFNSTVAKSRLDRLIQDNVRTGETEYVQERMTLFANVGSYLDEITPILSEYEIVRSNESHRIILVGVKSIDIPADPNLKRRLHLIERFLSIAKRYIILDITHVSNEPNRCKSCDRIVNENNAACECGLEQNMFVQDVYQTDTGKAGGNKGGYTDRKTFIKAMQRYEGIFPDAIPQSVYTDIDAYFKSKGLPDGEQIRKTGYETTVALLVDALKETKNATYYKSINLIGHRHLGWVLPNLDAIRDDILRDYDRTQDVYRRIRTRNSSLNANIRLYLHLKSKDYPCKITDFKILSQTDSLKYHQQMWKQMCKETGVKYTALV